MSYAAGELSDDNQAIERSVALAVRDHDYKQSAIMLLGVESERASLLHFTLGNSSFLEISQTPALWSQSSGMTISSYEGSSTDHRFFLGRR